jgi:hypothetical protein
MSQEQFELFSQVCSLLNLWQAFITASKGRRSHPSVAAFEYNLEPELVALRDELESGKYQPGGYCSFSVHEPKRRKISAAPFRDRVIHHALINVIGPLLERQFIFDSYANQVGKGTHRALDRCTYFMRRNEYVLPCDVTQFFPSIDHAVLRGILASAVGDERVMNLIDRILASGEGILASEYDMNYFSGDDLFAVQRPRGLPIGNLTSQFWANVYLNELDQYAKRVLKARAYVRYVDDFLLFSNDKQQLWEWKLAVVEFLSRLRLTLHNLPSQPRPCATGVTFLGFIVFPSHRRLKPPKGYAFQRRLKGMASAWRVGDLSSDDLRIRAVAWSEHNSHGDNWNLKQSVFQHARRAHG